jgi:hypothetical protein
VSPANKSPVKATHQPKTGEAGPAGIPLRRVETALQTNLYSQVRKIVDRCGNDPSAGSPTETLLRLHLPLNDKV